MLPFAAFADEVTRVEVQTMVAATSDGCLDHSVRELGMSAKRVEGDRAWNIRPQFLHPSVTPGGTVVVRFDEGEGATVVKVTASWPGAPKEADLEREIEDRLEAMASKLAQICGVVRPSVACAIAPAGAPLRACGR